MRLFIVLLALILSGCVTQTTYKGSNNPVKEQKRDDEEIAKTRISLGLAYLQKQQMSQAKLNFEKALEFAPRMAEAHYSLGYYYQVVGNAKRAEESYRKAISLDPRNADALNNFGVFLCEQKNYEEAQDYFLKALDQPSYIRSGETYENLGLCSMQAEQIDKALGYFEKALNYDPNSGKSLSTLTLYHLEKGDVENANKYLNRLLKLTPLTAEALWLAYHVSNAQNRPDIAANWLQQMLTRFPNSPRSKAYLETLKND